MDLDELTDQEIIRRYAALYGFVAFHKIDSQELKDLTRQLELRDLQWNPSPNRKARRALARKRGADGS